MSRPRVAWSPAEVDEVAVYRAVRGERLRLNGPERVAAVAELTRGQQSAREIAERLGVSERTTQRYRQVAVEAGVVAAGRRPSAVPHGTPAGAAWHRRTHERLCEQCRAVEGTGRVAEGRAVAA